MKKLAYDPKYPSFDQLRLMAKRRMPNFAFEYLDGGCNEDVNLFKNTKELRDVELVPQYIKQQITPNTETTLFGKTYAAPFGVSPVGLQGLMWPGSSQILAKAAHANNLPFILSTVTTMSIEEASQLTESNFWFQLYYPTASDIREDIIGRAEKAGCEVLVLLCDVPSFGFRPRDIRNGLSMPPRMTLSNIIQMLKSPAWSMASLRRGIPTFETLRPYIPAGFDMKKLGQFMDQTFSGKLDEKRISEIRKRWKGKIVLKGVATVEDTEMALNLGLDAVLISNHGGRQVDVGPSSVGALLKIQERYKGKFPLLFDSGIRSGADVGRALGAGADFCFLGRSFMYSVGALGPKGGQQAIGLLKAQLTQVMDQLGCQTPDELFKTKCV